MFSISAFTPRGWDQLIVFFPPLIFDNTYYTICLPDALELMKLELFSLINSELTGREREGSIFRIPPKFGL